jgi:hypothetical protein
VSSTIAYDRYMRHYVLGIIYDRVEGIPEGDVYDIASLGDIPSVARNFRFFLQEKYRIAADRPGSGNTRNIGSTTYEDRLVNGNGVFARLGIEVFDDYWMNYRTQAMAERDGFEESPYTNLKNFQAFRRRGAGILSIPDDDIETESDDEN